MGRGCTFSHDGEEASAKVCEGCFKLDSHNWLEGMPDVFPDDIFEVRFKNTRKSYFKNASNLPLKTGDIVAVEASPGHDIGIVSLTGDLVARQMKRVGFNPLNGEFKKIYRKAKPYDIEKWQEAIAMEHQTMIRSRQIASELGLNMKIGDVEYQGDKIKAIFYYIADERVDFRELIKIFAEQFRVRIEMKQIGARQEAGRIGGLGSCGRELCCASWMSSFASVTTNSARHQEISLNPQKLAGQCGKLKCCLVYEVDTYLDARKDFPRIHQPLQALDGEYYLVKTDILGRTMSFSTDPHSLAGMKTLNVNRVKEILSINQRGQKVDSLVAAENVKKVEEPTYANVVGEDSLTRFDTQREPRRKSRNKNGNGGRKPGEGGESGGAGTGVGNAQGGVGNNAGGVSSGGNNPNRNSNRNPEGRSNRKQRNPEGNRNSGNTQGNRNSGNPEGNPNHNQGNRHNRNPKANPNGGPKGSNKPGNDRTSGNEAESVPREDAAQNQNKNRNNRRRPSRSVGKPHNQESDKKPSNEQ